MLLRNSEPGIVNGKFCIYIVKHFLYLSSGDILDQRYNGHWTLCNFDLVWSSSHWHHFPSQSLLFPSLTPFPSSVASPLTHSPKSRRLLAGCWEATARLLGYANQCCLPAWTDSRPAQLIAIAGLARDSA